VDIEFCSTEELIQELVNRSSFVGAILYSSDEQRYDSQVHNKFTLTANVADRDQLVTLFENTLCRLKDGSIKES
jgi:hypothetical protein